MNNAYRLTNNTPLVVVSQTAYIFALHIAIANEGASTMKMQVRNRETPDPKILIPPYTLYVEPDIGASVPFRPPNPRQFEWLNNPKLMKNGIVIALTGAASDADVSVWIDYQTAEGSS